MHGTQKKAGLYTPPALKLPLPDAIYHVGPTPDGGELRAVLKSGALVDA